jgi:hypothetical protein
VIFSTWICFVVYARNATVLSRLLLPLIRLIAYLYFHVFCQTNPTTIPLVQNFYLSLQGPCVVLDSGLSDDLVMEIVTSGVTSVRALLL